jgi:ribosomal protein S18 acetylase RimI-like enzyme
LYITRLSMLNEYNFCKSWSNFLLSDNGFYEVISNSCLDDYFINRVTIGNGLKTSDLNEIVLMLRSYSKLYNMPFYIHLREGEKEFEKYFGEKGLEKVDELYGLIFDQSMMAKETLVGFNWVCDDKNNGVSILNEMQDLDNWVNVYCSCFNLETKSNIVFDIMKKNFKKFIFLLYSDNYEKKGKVYAGCCLLYPYKDAIGLYCLGTAKEFRNRHIASRMIRYSILQSIRNNYLCFVLQTLKSDGLLPFYEKHGFCRIYSNKIYGYPNG